VPNAQGEEFVSFFGVLQLREEPNEPTDAGIDAMMSFGYGMR